MTALFKAQRVKIRKNSNTRSWGPPCPPPLLKGVFYRRGSILPFPLALVNRSWMKQMPLRHFICIRSVRGAPWSRSNDQPHMFFPPLLFWMTEITVHNKWLLVSVPLHQPWSQTISWRRKCRILCHLIHWLNYQLIFSGVTWELLVTDFIHWSSKISFVLPLLLMADSFFLFFFFNQSWYLNFITALLLCAEPELLISWQDQH